MSRRKPIIVWWLSWLTASLASLGGCTDTELYQWRHDPYQANKLSVSGTVCSDDPHQRNFPVKILFIIDTSMGVMGEKNDAHGWRGRAIDDVIGLWGKSPNYSFGVIAYGAKARNLIEDGFTRDSALLTSAAAAVKGTGGITSTGGCLAGRCRDLRAAMSLASSIVTGDILASEPGEVSRSTYVLVLFSGGPPVPPVARCGCRDKTTEDSADLWKACPWDECDGCKVTCPASTTCKDYTCYPVCTPSCGSGGYCDSDFTCKQGSPSGTPTVQPIGAQGPLVPDSFTQWVPPAKPSFKLPSGASACNLSCVYPPGNPDSCEERTLVSLVRDMREFARKNGVAQLQLHSTYLPDMETRAATDPFNPPCSPAADQARSVRLLSEMAFAGGGGFTQFGQATAISFRNLDLHTSRDPLLVKELLVSNMNVLADSGGIFADTDGDGLSDVVEEQLGTCPRDEDTDGDGISDAVELRLALNPLRASDPIECVDLTYTTEIGPDPCGAPGETKTWKRYDDRDGDGLNACEERLLGTEDTLFDTDADGLPDKIEFIAGTNYLDNDALQDADFDGMVNRDEIRGHTDPRANDAQFQLDLAYRYEETDEGLKQVLSFSQPMTITGVTVKSVSPNSGAGAGLLKFDPGPPPTLAWRDYSDMVQGGDFGPAVDISKASGNVQLFSCRRESAPGGGTQCTDESQTRYIVVMTEGEKTYPSSLTVGSIVISAAIKHCLSFKVRNITLLETDTHRIYNTRGNNLISLFFAQTPKGAKDTPGFFRVASVRLNYTKGPPESRSPKAANIHFTDEDFVLRE